MRIFRLAGAAALAFLAGARVTAQSSCDVKNALGHCVPQQALIVAPADSIAQEGTVTSTAATPTSGSATFAGGTAYIGPLTPQLGRDIRVILKGTWGGSFAIGTASAANGCTAGNINPLTVAGQSWGSFIANANEVVDMPTLGASGASGAPVYCAIATISSGTLTYAVRQ